MRAPLCATRCKRVPKDRSASEDVSLLDLSNNIANDWQSYGKLDQLKLARLPGLVEPRSQGTIQPENGKPAFACDSLGPVFLKALRRIGTEIEIY